MKKLPSFAFSRLAERQAKSSKHSDADLLVAFAQGTATRAERDAVLGHAADCPDCREVLSRIQAADSVPAVSHQVASGAIGWWGWRVAAAAATLVVVGAAVWEFFPHKYSPVIAKPALPQVPLIVAPPPNVVMQEKPKAHKSAIRHKQLSAPQALPKIASPEHPADILAPIPQPAPPQSMRVYAFGPAGAALPSMSVNRNGTSIWSLAESADGVVRKSDDGGKTWQTVPVDGLTRFYALSADGENVWVGGANGRLFHSVDGGIHWSPVAITNTGAARQESIVGIEAHGRMVRLKTASGLTLESKDGGEYWEQQ